MANLFTPERQPGESQDQYRARRREAKAHVLANKRISNAGASARQQLRDAMRANGTMGKRTRAYQALMAAWAAKRVTKTLLRDERGAYTLIGGVYHLEGIAPSANEHVISGGSDGDLKFYTVRRKWVGGISEQRGA